MKTVLNALFLLLCVQTIVPIVKAGNDCLLHDIACCCSKELKIQIALLIRISELLAQLTQIELLNLQQPQVLQMLNNEIEQLSQNEHALITPALLEAIQKQHVIQLQEMQYEVLN